MTYAPAHRAFCDADSHIMELRDFLCDDADPAIREQHPALRGACVELGAGWVPAMLTRLDWVVPSWSKVDQYLADQLAADLYLFPSDPPHMEGGRGPIGRFVRDQFSAENFLRIFPDARVH